MREIKIPKPRRQSRKEALARMEANWDSPERKANVRKGVAKRFENMTEAERSASGKRASDARWGKKKGV